MNNSWGYNASDLNFKTPQPLIQQLATVVSRDGNYLLNIGPKGDGTIPEQEIAILDSFGVWMNIYGESIYGATRSPYSTEPHWGVYTKKDGKLYAHVFTRPINGLLRIPSLTNTINKIYSMNDTTAQLSYNDSSGCTTISVQASSPDVANPVIVVDVSGVPSASTQYVKVTSITVKSARELKTISSKEDTLQMSATISPSNAAIKSVTWRVSDTKIASISENGLLMARRNGKVNVIAISNDGTDIQGAVQISISGQTEVDDRSGQMFPDNPELKQNYPNPFNPRRRVARHQLPSEGHVILKVYDILGRNVKTLVNSDQAA
jgi:hypothetical protein